jgi:hypothetical protein
MQRLQQRQLLVPSLRRVFSSSRQRSLAAATRLLLLLLLILRRLSSSSRQGSAAVATRLLLLQVQQVMSRRKSLHLAAMAKVLPLLTGQWLVCHVSGVPAMTAVCSSRHLNQYQ